MCGYQVKEIDAVQLVFTNYKPSENIRILYLENTMGGPLWFRWKDDWVRQSWCGQFQDGTPRPPWLDDQFNDLWKNEGKDAARDISRYDLTEQNLIIQENSPRR
jgi:hypothetical protein